MYHCYKQKRGFVLFWVFKIQEAQLSGNGLKTKQHMKYNCLLLRLQKLTKQDSVWKTPRLCVPVRGIMETVLSWHTETKPAPTLLGELMAGFQDQ